MKILVGFRIMSINIRKYPNLRTLIACRKLILLKNGIEESLGFREYRRHITFGCIIYLNLMKLKLKSLKVLRWRKLINFLNLCLGKVKLSSLLKNLPYSFCIIITLGLFFGLYCSAIMIFHKNLL